MNVSRKKDKLLKKSWRPPGGERSAVGIGARRMVATAERGAGEKIPGGVKH